MSPVGQCWCLLILFISILTYFVNYIFYIFRRNSSSWTSPWGLNDLLWCHLQAKVDMYSIHLDLSLNLNLMFVMGQPWVSTLLSITLWILFSSTFFNLDFIFEILQLIICLASFLGYAMLLWCQLDAALLSTSGKSFVCPSWLWKLLIPS